MISEASKREKITNAVLGATFALSAAQSPQDFVKTGKIESPGTALMQTWAKKRGEAERNLDSGRVSHPARNRMKKTFKEFVEEAYLHEMRKEDKVKGKQKTPLYLTTTHKKLEKSPEGKWERKDIPVKRPNPTAAIGRYKQGREGHAHYYSTEGGTSGGPGFGYRPQPHGEGGSSRGVKKVRGGPTPGPTTTPAQKVANKRKKKAYTGYDYRKGFSGY